MTRPVAAALLAGSVAAPLLFRALPFSVFQSGVELCLFKLAFGVSCPGCGMTRALYWLTHLELHRAISYNWRVVIVAPILFGMWARFVWSLLRVLAARQTESESSRAIEASL